MQSKMDFFWGTPRLDLRSYVWLVLASFAILNLLPASTSAQGGAVGLNGPLVAGGDVRDSMVSPDGSRVIYLADQDTNDVFELYSVPISGGEPVKLNEPLDGERDVSGSSSVTPDGRRIIYIASQDTAGVFELFSVPTEGGAVTKLNDPLPGGADVSFTFLSPDSEAVFYVADQTTDNVNELHRVPATGGTVTKLNDALTPGGNVGFSPRVSPDGSAVVYLADRDTNTVFELFSVPAAGGAVTKLNPPLSSTGGVDGFSVRISADSTTVIFRALESFSDGRELFSVPINGGVAVKLNGLLVSGGSVDRAEITPDGSRVIYLADQETDDFDELFSVPIGGGVATKLSDPKFGSVSNFAASADGATVVFRTSGDDGEIFSVPGGGGTPTKLNAALPDTDRIGGFQISPDASTVVYSSVPADVDGDGEATAKGDGPPSNALFSVPLAGGPVTQILERFPDGRGIGSRTIFPDSGSVIFTADRDTAGVSELFAVSIGDGAVEKISAPLVDGGGVSSFSFAPNATHILYHADQNVVGVVELFSVSRSAIGVLDPLFLDGFEETR